MRQVNDMLRRALCEKNGVSFICNDIITTNYLRKDGVHLQDMETYFKQSFFKVFKLFYRQKF